MRQKMSQRQSERTEAVSPFSHNNFGSGSSQALPFFFFPPAIFSFHLPILPLIWKDSLASYRSTVQQWFS